MKRKKYDKSLPRKMYLYFTAYSGIGAPSFTKFAISIGATLADIENWKKHPKFLHACSECNEIRRDYLIDNALAKKQDASMTRFLLSAEYRMDDAKRGDDDKRLEVTLEVAEE